MESAAIAVSIVATVSTVSQLIAISVFGWIADRFDRRKLVVGLSAFGMGISFAVPLLFPTWSGMLAYGVLNGVFFAVDLALMSLVLPSQGDEGRDLGLLAIATSARRGTRGATPGVGRTAPRSG